jgi:hypothetical protein
VVLEKDGEDQFGDCARNVEVLHTVKEDRNVLPTTKRRKANWCDHILLIRCLLKHAIEEKNLMKVCCDGKTRKKT